MNNKTLVSSVIVLMQLQPLRWECMHSIKKMLKRKKREQGTMRPNDFMSTYVHDHHY